MRVGQIVEFDSHYLGTVCRIFPQGSLDACEVLTRSKNHELVVVTLRRVNNMLVSTTTVCHTIPSEYDGLSVPAMSRSA